MKFSTLVVVHYHLLTGGFRSAFEKSLDALNMAGHLKGIKIYILVGRKKGVVLRDVRAESAWLFFCNM